MAESTFICNIRTINCFKFLFVETIKKKLMDRQLRECITMAAIQELAVSTVACRSSVFIVRQLLQMKRTVQPTGSGAYEGFFLSCASTTCNSRQRHRFNSHRIYSFANKLCRLPNKWFLCIGSRQPSLLSRMMMVLQLPPCARVIWTRANWTKCSAGF